jgi:hypothetical protein
MDDLKLLALAEEMSTYLQFDPKRIRKVLRWLDKRMMLEDHGKVDGVRPLREEVEAAADSETAEVMELLKQFTYFPPAAGSLTSSNGDAFEPIPGLAEPGLVVTSAVVDSDDPVEIDDFDPIPPIRVIDPVLIAPSAVVGSDAPIDPDAEKQP